MADETGARAEMPEPASAGRQAVSEVLGDRYEIVGKLGAGAFGEVYEANDTALGRKVAIKRIRLDAFAEGPELEEVKQRFVREAQTAAKLRHPNVVTVHDIAARGSSSFMVMELVEGQTLQALLRQKGRLPVAETLRILRQAAAALDFAHAQGVVHRDVKPANLMIEPSGHVKVMDFGIAKGAASADITKTGAIMGTPNYMSPEQARGDKVDGRADLFSLGCILYECLSGRRPFVGDSLTAILMKILTEPPPPIDFGALALPAPLGDMVRRALAKDPAERFPSGQALVEAAEKAAGLAAEVPRTVVDETRRAAVPAAVSPPIPAAPAAAAAHSPLATGGASFRHVLVVVMAAAVVGGLAWAALASRRARNAEALEGVRVSRNVTREEPGVVRKLLGARPRLHVTVPAGTAVRVRLETALSSETSSSGQAFTASTSAPVVVEGVEALPAGSHAAGHVSHAAGAGKVSGRGELSLELDHIAPLEGSEIAVEAEPVERKARSTVKKDAAKVGGSAGVGAVVGGLIGGGKGAAIGGAVGGAAGTGVVLATKGEEVVLPEGSSLEFRLRAPLTVTVEASSK
jgi:tRNA A-37 threonylcarbamoyl transferase component Bud32